MSESKIERSQVDNPYQRNLSPDSFKNRSFDGGRITTDAYTGKQVYYSANGVSRSGNDARHYTTKTTSNVDHVTPIDVLIERYGDKIPVEDLKIIANSDYNLAITNEALNKQKGGMTNLEFLLQQLKNGTPENAETTIRMLSAQLKSETNIKVDISELLVKEFCRTGIATAQTAGKVFAQGASDALAASVIPLVIKGTQDLCHVASGDMTLKEATEDVGKLGGSILVSGGTTRLATYALSHSLINSKNEILTRFAEANQIGTVLVVGSLVAKAAGKYLNGEVDEAGFIDEIGQDGLSMISGMLASKAVVSLLGGATGLVAAATPVLAAMIASAACSEIYSKAKKVLQEQRDNLEIQHIADTASAEIAKQQIELKRLMGESHAKWLDDMHTAFEKIAFGLTNGNVLQTNDGLCQIMSLYHVDASLYQSGDDVLDDLISFRNGTQDFHLLHS